MNFIDMIPGSIIQDKVFPQKVWIILSILKDIDWYYVKVLAYHDINNNSIHYTWLKDERNWQLISK